MAVRLISCCVFDGFLVQTEPDRAIFIEDGVIKEVVSGSEPIRSFESRLKDSRLAA